MGRPVVGVGRHRIRRGCHTVDVESNDLARTHTGDGRTTHDLLTVDIHQRIDANDLHHAATDCVAAWIDRLDNNPRRRWGQVNLHLTIQEGVVLGSWYCRTNQRQIG